MALVQFYDVTPEQFKNLTTKDESVLYFLSNGQLYKGGQLIGNNIELITDSFPLTGVKGILYIKPSTGESKYWDGTQFLDFTKEITTLINAASTDEEIPTAAAVRTYASSVATDKANAAQSNAETNANKYTDSVKTTLQALINKKAPSADGVSADSALKLTTSTGDVNKPVYFKNGVPVDINFTINKSVPSDAKFTDTTYENATQSAAGLMSAEDKKRLDGLVSGDKNQNAFSKVVVGSSTIQAETTTDTLTIAAGTNVTLTPDVSADKITIAAKDTTYTKGTGINISDTNVISNAGVRSISSGSTNGTISVNTNGTVANVAVKGLGSAAYATKGGANGVAELDANGKVLTSQLPSYVDDVVEYGGLANFPTTGTTGIIYVDTATNKTYRWSGTKYVEISASLALGNTSSTAFRGDYGHTLYSNLNVSKGSDTKPIYLKNGVPTEVASEYVTLDTTQTITGNKTFTGVFDFSNTTGKLSSHYYHRLHGDNHVYVHYYPGAGDASTPTTFADLRVWDATNRTFKTLRLGGDGTFRWDGANIITSGGGTITGRLNTNDLKNLGHYSMLNKKNFSMIANANDSEFSFDIGASDIGLSSDSGYTGAYAQFWSCKNSKPIAIFRNDDMSVSIPNGNLSVSGNVTASFFNGQSTAASRIATTIAQPNPDSGLWIISVPNYAPGNTADYSVESPSFYQSNQYGTTLRIKYNTTSTYYTDIYTNANSATLAYKTVSNGVSKGWKMILDSSNYSGYALPLSGGTMTGNIVVPYGKGIIQHQRSDSNYTSALCWYKGGTSQASYDPQIGQHNTGGDGTGSISILPYPTESNPWEGAVGLFIQKGVMKLDGVPVLTAAGFTLNNSAVIKFPASAGSISVNDPMSITYGRISSYGTLAINADTDGSKNEAVIITAGRGHSSSAADGLSIGYSTLSWQGNTVVTSGNYSSYALPLYGGTLTGNINYTMYSSTQTPFKVYGGDVNGQGISIGAGAATLVGAGESAKWLESQVSATAEELHIASDGIIKFWTNCQSQNTGAAAVVYLDSSRNFYPGTNGTGSIGTASLRWGSVYSNNGNFSGGVNISGDLTLRNSYIHTASGTAGTAGYVKVCQIKITQAYNNQPIEIKYSRRDDSNTTRLYIAFANSGSTDPTLNSFKYIGHNNKAWLYKSATSTWDLYIQKAESYDSINILEYHKPPYNGGITVTWTDVHATSVPSGATQAGLTGNIYYAYTAGTASACSGNSATATTAAKLGQGGATSTAMTFNWSGQSGQPTWLWGGSNGTDMYVYNPSNFSVKYAANAGHAANLTANNSFDYGVSGVTWFDIDGKAGKGVQVNDTPTSAWWHILRFNHSNSNGFYTDLAVPFNNNSLYYKVIRNGALVNSGWVTVLDSLNYSGYTVPKTGGTFSGSIFTAHSTGGETQVGVTHKTGNLYFWGNNSSGTRGIYDGKKGYIIQVTDTAATFYGALSGNASTATTSTSTSYVKDKTNSTATYLNYGAAAIADPTYLAGWNGYELRAVSRTAVTVGYASRANSVLGSYTGNGGLQKPNYFGTNKVGFLMMNATVNGNSQYKDWIIMDCYSGSDVGGGVALGVNRQSLGAYIMRSAAARTSWAESAELLHTANSSKSASYSSGLSIGTVKMAGSTSTYYVPYATASQSGAVSTTAQTFGGVKTFNSGLASNGNISLANSAYIVGKNSAGTECKLLTITNKNNIAMNTSFVGNVNIYGYAEQSFDPGFSDGPAVYTVNLYMRNAATASNVNLFSVGGSTNYGNTAVAMSSDYYYSVVRSAGIYKRTTTSAANVFISSSGHVLMRSTSASKYKLNIKKIEQPDSYYYNTLKLSPKQWNDKGSVEAYANYLTRSINNNKIKEDEEEKEFLNNIDITPVYGLVAEDVEKAGLEKYCVYAYDEETQKNEIEGIQYDRLWIPLIPVVRDIVLSMQKILPVIIPSIRDEETLAEVLKLLNKFNSFNEADVID